MLLLHFYCLQHPLAFILVVSNKFALLPLVDKLNLLDTTRILLYYLLGYYDCYKKVKSIPCTWYFSVSKKKSQLSLRYLEPDGK